MEFSDDLFSFSTRLVFGTEGLTNDLKVYWGKMLSFFYSSKYSGQQFTQKEMQSALQGFKSQEEYLASFTGLSLGDKVLAIVLLKLLYRHTQVLDQPIASQNLNLRIEFLTGNIAGEDINRIEIEYEKCFHLLARHENRRKIVVPASIALIAADYFLKWIILFLCRIYSVSSGVLNSLMFIESLLFIGVFIYVSYADRKHNQKLFQKHKAVDDFKIDFQFSAQKYTWLAFFFTTSIIISNFSDAKDEGGTTVDYIFNVVLFMLYYTLALRIFQSGKLSESSLLRQLRIQGGRNETLDADENDEAIVNIETEINSRTGRLDAYVLESALFGALAFSGFLQIISTDFVSFKELDQFSKLFFDVVQNLISMDINKLNHVSQQLYTKNNLFSLAAIETLLCSGFFIAVIASRLRFSNSADKVKQAIEIAKAYNNKEELLKGSPNTNPDHSKMLLHYNLKINEQIGVARKALEEIGPISGYMEYFRNAGLLMFLLVLISCGLFVTSFLGWLYISIGAATWIYFNRQTLNSKSKELILILQVEFTRRPYILLIISLFILLTGFLLRIIWGMEETTVLITSGFAGLGLYVFLLLIVLPHYDESFGAIGESQSNYYSGKWNTIFILYAFLALAFSSSLSLYSFVRYEFAFSFSIIVAFFFGVMNLCIGYYCCKKKWLGLLIGFGFLIYSVNIGGLVNPTGSSGNGSRLFLSIIIGSSLVSFLATTIWKNQFHILMKKISLIYFSLLLFLTLPSFYHMVSHQYIPPFSTASVALYQHKTYQFDGLYYWLNNESPKGISRQEKLDFALKKCRAYRETFGAKNGFTFIYSNNFEHLYASADSLLKAGKKNSDSLTLNTALKFAKECTSIHEIFKFKNMIFGGEVEANILAEMKRKPEAINSLTKIINSDAEDDVKKVIRNRLKEIQALQIK